LNLFNGHLFSQSSDVITSPPLPQMEILVLCHDVIIWRRMRDELKDLTEE